MRRWWRLGPPAGISALLGVGVGLFVNLLTSGWSWPVVAGFAVAVVALVAWEVARERMSADTVVDEFDQVPPTNPVTLTVQAQLGGVAAGSVNGDVTVNNTFAAPYASAPEAVVVPAGLHGLPAVAAALFLGRDEELAELGRAVSAAGGVIGQAVHGLGGVGKTELALRYCYERLAEYSLVWWTSGETADLLINGVAAVAERLAGVARSADGYAWAVRWLQTHSGWLLVVDNVEDPAVLEELLGAVQGRGRVLVTTRRDLALPVWARLGLAPLRLDVLGRSASVALLQGLTGIAEEGTRADLLAEDLGDLPLALEQAGAFMAQQEWSYTKYREVLAAQPTVALDSVAEGTKAERAVARVWSVTMKSIARRDPRAAEVMSLLGWLSAEPLPDQVLNPSGNDLNVQKAIALLASYSMVRWSRGTIRVHRLVQAVSRANDPRPTQHQRQAAQLLAEAAPTDPLTSLTGWPMWAQLLPHIEQLNANTPQDRQSSDLWSALERAANYLQTQVQHGRAIPLLGQVAADRSRVLGPNDPDTLRSRSNLAGAYRSVGRLDEAIPLYEQVTADSTRVLGPHHPDTLRFSRDLAGVYRSVGRFRDAIPVYEQVAADSTRVLGADHPDTLDSSGALAGAYAAAGRFDEAIPLYEQVAADSTRVFGADDPRTLGSFSNLALAYQSAGRLDEAISLHEQVAVDAVRVLSADHPSTLVSRSFLADAYRAADRLAEAIPLYEQAAADAVRVLGTDHPDTVNSLNALAGAYAADGRLGEAISVIEQAAVDAVRMVGAEHPLALASLINLARVYDADGRLNEAIPLYEQVATGSTRVYGADHPNTHIAVDALADAYEWAGRLGEAIPLYEQVAADAQRALGADHPDTLVSRNNLACAYRAAGRLSEAIPLHEQVAADAQRVLGADHPDTAVFLQNLAVARRLVGDGRTTGARVIKRLPEVR